MKLSTLFFLTLVTALGLLLAPLLVASAPEEMSMGLVQKVFYYHVPMAWLTFLSALISAGGAVTYLMRGSKKGAALSYAAAELVVLFGACVLVTGPLWAHKAWGTWWVWKDVRLITTLVLWLSFAATLLVRHILGPSGARIAAGVAILAAVDVPLVYFSVFFWRTQHPEASVVATLEPAMRPAFFISLSTFTLFYALLLAFRWKLELARQRIDELHVINAEDPL